MKAISLDIVCSPCGGTGLYVGLAERNGSAVVCSRCKGTGKDTFSYTPFTERKSAPSKIKTVHVGRGYLLGDTAKEGGLPIAQWQPGVSVPADEAYYCPFLYTYQGWCAKPEPDGYSDRPRAPLLAGQGIDSCKHWDNKADCWRLFHAEAPLTAKEQVS